MDKIERKYTPTHPSPSSSLCPFQNKGWISILENQNTVRIAVRNTNREAKSAILVFQCKLGAIEAMQKCIVSDVRR